MERSSMTFLKLGNQITKTKYSQKESTKIRRFKSFFGTTPHVCSIVWEKISVEAPDDFQPKHLLWSLVFLKQYTSEHVRHALLKADEKTIRKWTWIGVKLLSNLNVIIWENRKHGSVPRQTSFCSIDGVDFKIKEPEPFSPRWFSHKFKGPGLRYGIGMCIRTGHIVWKYGGYPCGEYPDLALAREAFVLSVDPSEKALADKGFHDQNFFILPNATNQPLH